MTSERILDGALALAAESGLRNLTMEDVARRAGVGRMTVYRRFGDRAGLVDALRTREAVRFLERMDAASDPGDPIEEQVAAGFATGLRLAREHPLLTRLARVEPETVVVSLRADGSGLLGACRAFLADRLRAAQEAGVLDAAVEADEAAEVLVRLMASFVLVEDTVLDVASEAGAREAARRLLAPMLSAGGPPGPRGGGRARAPSATSPT